MECEVKVQGGDPHAGVVTEPNPVGFGTTMEEENTLSVAEREMWLNSDQDEFLGVNEASMFYADFPPLPDFPCMSSSSSSSSAPPLPLKTMTCSTTTTATTATSSSSSSSSWAVLKSDVEEDADKNHCKGSMHDQFDATTLSSTASMEISQQQNPDLGVGGSVGECMEDVMDTFGYMELLEANDFFDPSSIFQDEESEEPLIEFGGSLEEQVSLQEEQPEMVNQQENTEEDGKVPVCEEIQGEEDGGGGGVADDEMSNVFLEWLKSNKDSVSANDLRNVKLKKATIESAARRLGGGKEAMKQLLKLILEWVQTSHLQNKRRRENSGNINSVLQAQFQDPSAQNNQNPHTSGSFAPEPNSCFNNQTPWLNPQTFGTDQAPIMVPTQPYPQPMVGYVGDPFTSGSAPNNHNNNPYQPGTDQYHMLESAHSWSHSQFNVASHYSQPYGDNGLFTPGAFGGYANNQYSYQFFHGPGDGLMRLGPSATKEARKKRMARQRRYLANNRNHNHLQNQGSDPHARLGNDNCTTGLVGPHQANSASPNWMYWQTMGGGPADPMAPAVPTQPLAGQTAVDRSTMQTQNSHQNRTASDRRQVGEPQFDQILMLDDFFCLML